MQINKKNLQEALEIVRPGLANKEVIEQSTSFAFINDRVVTYNDEISISHPVKGLELEGAVLADRLYAILNKLKQDEIDLTVHENEIHIASGRTRVGLTLQQEIKLPLDNEIAKRGKWKSLPENFLRFVSFAMSACGKDMSHPILTCIHVNKEGFIEASDNLRIVRCELGEEMPVKTFLLPATSAVNVVKLQPTKVAEGAGWIHFQTETDTIISCRIYEGTFPNISSFLKVEGTRVVFPRTTDEVLDRAIIFAKRDHILDESVDVMIENKRLKIHSADVTGWFDEEVNIHHEGETLQFSITPYLLRSILSETLGCTVSKNKLKFEGEGWIYITTLKE